MNAPATPAMSIGRAPGRLPFVGHARQLLFRPLEFLKSQRDRGDIVVFHPGPQRAYLVNNPELVHQMLTTHRRDFVKGGPLFEATRIAGGDGLINSDGDLHRRQRRLIQPVFHPERMPGYVAIMGDVAGATSESWHDGQSLDINREMYNLSGTVMARCLYTGRLSAELVTEIIDSIPIILEGMGRRAAVPIPWLHSLPTRENRRFTRAVAAMHRLTDQIVADHRANGAGQDDFLSLLLSVRDEDTGEPMSDQQVHDEVITLATAATETTALMMSWALHVLAARPDVEAKVLAELDEVVGDRPVTYTDLSRLTYLGAVANETLRVHPPVWLLPRRAATDTSLGGHPIPAGSSVFFSPYANHHDPVLFADPETFDPDRWLPDQPKPPRCAHIPFGAGTRKCIGDTFGTQEAIISLATLIRNWTFHPDPDRPVRARAFSTLSTGPLVMTVSRRTSTPVAHHSDTAGGNDPS